jgi:hypothetical protein
MMAQAEWKTARLVDRQFHPLQHLCILAQAVLCEVGRHLGRAGARGKAKVGHAHAPIDFGQRVVDDGVDFAGHRLRRAAPGNAGTLGANVFEWRGLFGSVDDGARAVNQVTDAARCAHREKW